MMVWSRHNVREPRRGAREPRRGAREPRRGTRKPRLGVREPHRGMTCSVRNIFFVTSLRGVPRRDVVCDLEIFPLS